MWLHCAGNIVLPWQLYGHVFGHVRASYPWWNMTEGRNHVVWANGDRGVCRLDAYPEYVSVHCNSHQVGKQ